MHKLVVVSLCPYVFKSKIAYMLHLTFKETRVLYIQGPLKHKTISDVYWTV